MIRHSARFLALVLALIAVPLVRGQTPAEHVIFITIDGLRWQEFFGGADRDYFKRDRNGDAGEPERRFWRDDRRRAPSSVDAVRVVDDRDATVRSSAIPTPAACRA